MGCLGLPKQQFFHINLETLVKIRQAIFAALLMYQGSQFIDGQTQSMFGGMYHAASLADGMTQGNMCRSGDGFGQGMAG